MIGEKKIEEAAQRYCNITDASKNEASLLSEGFKEGVRWFKKSLWHDASERPIERDYGEWILLKTAEKYNYCSVLQIKRISHWKALTENYPGVRWLYINDLLLEEGGEG